MAFLLFAAVVLTLQLVVPQSSIGFETGTSVEVTVGADICADSIGISGTYDGSGTKCESALPVELISLTATSERMTITLRWKTATEVNNLGFDVERRSINNGKLTMDNWSRIGFVEGNGTANSPKEYSFIDRTVQGTSAYRLKQIDRDGKIEYSKEIEVSVGTVPKVFALEQNYPNPFNPSTTIGFTLRETGPTTLKVFDMIGREVATLANEDLEAGVYHQTMFDASRLVSGTYFARLQNGGNVQIRKMTLLK